MTHQRKRILEAIVQFMLDYEYPPTVEEIGDMVGLRSKNTVWTHLRKLEEDGEIEIRSGSPRAIRVKGVRYIDDRKRA
jgi:repressor LexA